MKSTQIVSLLTAAALSAAFVSHSQAAFVNGVETFRGTTMDTSTWTAAFPQSLSQDNALYYNSHGGASYNTKTQTVSWGQTVRMMVSVTSATSGFSLFLTNNSAGPAAFGAFNSAFWSFDLGVSSDPVFDRIIMGTGSNGAWGDGSNGIFALKPMVDHEYGLQIEPRSATTAIFTVFDSDGSTVLESHLYTISPSSPEQSVPNNLHISLTGTNGTAMVSSVAIPEPASLALLALGTLPLLNRLRKP